MKLGILEDQKLEVKKVLPRYPWALPSNPNIGIPYFGTNRRIADAIDFVLQKVPQPVRSFALRQCIFTSLSRNLLGCCCNLGICSDIFSPLFLIEISEELPFISSFRYRKSFQTNLQFTVAHELAHAYLNHGELNTETQLSEVEADEMAEQWGFNPYKSKRSE